MAYGFGTRQMIYEECTEDSSSRQGDHRKLLLCLIGLLAIISMGTFLTIHLVYKDSSHASTDTATEITLPPLQLPQPSVPVTSPSTSITVQQLTMVKAKPPSIDIARLVSVADPTCSTVLCHFLAQWLRSKLDDTIDPCQDFYRYVCRTFDGRDQISDTGDLVAWMTSLNLDLANETRLAKVPVVETIVRCALHFGIHVIISITFRPSLFYKYKRAMLMEYSVEQLQSQLGRWRIPRNTTLVNYMQQLRWFNVDPSLEAQLAARIIEYEQELSEIESYSRSRGERYRVGEIRGLGAVTKPHIDKRMWIKLFSKYTNRTYRGNDNIVYKLEPLRILVTLITHPSVSYKGLRYLIAWSVFRQMVKYTEPELLVGGRRVDHACYDHVLKVLKLALVSPFLQTVIKPGAIKEANRTVNKIREAFRLAVKSSKWIKGKAQRVALRKLTNMKQYVGSPGKRHDHDFVEKYYEMYPDVPLDQFFTPWRKALSFSAYQTWTDQTTWLYDESVVNAQYTPFYNSIIIPTALLQRPFLFLDGPAALTYGGLGTIIGHEIMHMYDVSGLTFDENAEKRVWVTPEFQTEYGKRAVCLRRSTMALRKRLVRQDIANDVLDSENLADFVGTAASYWAYTSLPAHERDVWLLGLNISAERLFFISHCIKYCYHYSDTEHLRYSPFHVRCMAPLANMPEFSTAFRCPPGSLMNPTNKCTFWS
ncbi:endothelin-converting enzyme homolog isoform X2 [Dermacentor albipictus]|uniref:endothelin-converting enzyme homolog isoform X2 n=1 Tax=Dermacentor albipictus TaxID=60249 RepID=UPI0031FD8EC5